MCVEVYVEVETRDVEAARSGYSKTLTIAIGTAAYLRSLSAGRHP